MTKRISEEHQKIMIDAYLDGASAAAAAARLGYSEMACRAALRKHKIPIRSLSQAKRRYALNEAFFDIINTEEKAYWLGFITADGSVNSRNNALQIVLQERDELHLLKFLASLQSGHRIYRIRNRTRRHVRVFIGSLHLKNALVQLGVTPNKTFTVTPCGSVPVELASHYWRGVFDGDGSIHNVKRKPGQRPAWGLKLVGSRAIVEGFRSFCQEFAKSRANVKPQKNSFNIKFTGVELIQAILQVLYGDATVYLDRKKELADHIINYSPA
jgi:DNA-binding transcriptional regulator WhiA